MRDHENVSKWANQHSLADRAKIISRCAEIAKYISSEDLTLAAKHIELIQKVELSKGTLTIHIDEEKMIGVLDIQTPTQHRESDAEALDVCSASLKISVKSHLVRSGKQVKLILGNDDHAPRKINEQLVNLIAKSRHWYDGLTSGRFPTLRAIAKDEDVDKSHVSRLLSVAFLAPDIIERILIGDHAATLTPERLRKACPLPVRWEDQRALLLD